MRRVALVGLLALVGATLAGCGPDRRSIPPGAQQVHVVVAGSELRLEPSTVRAGVVYVVLDTPGTSIGFVQRKRTAAETPGPLTDDDIARLGRGDTGGTSIGGFDDVGCSPEQRADSRGHTGPCGNAFEIFLTPGKHAFFTGQIDGMPPGDYSGQIAVLEVVP